MEKVRRIYDVLRSTRGSGFPVILAPRKDATGSAAAEHLAVHDIVPGSLAGIVLRKQLLVLLSVRGIETARYAPGSRPAQDEARGTTLYVVVVVVVVVGGGGDVVVGVVVVVGGGFGVHAGALSCPHKRANKYQAQ